MDTLSHTLWGKGLFGYRKYGSLALLFGALPDLLSFGLYFLVRLLSQGMNIEFGRPAVGTIPDWVFTCLLYTSPSPRDRQKSRMPSSA